MSCFFDVFKKLEPALIMGGKFLTATETLSKFRHQFQAKERVLASPLHVYAFNNPRRRLRCLVESKPILANADTGSELDLISLAYVNKRSRQIHPIHPDDSTVRFADGSTASLWGAVDIDVSLDHWENLVSRVKRVFYILNGLTSDILFGQQFLNETCAFESYRSAFTFQHYENRCSEISTITWVTTKKKHIKWTKENRQRVKAPEPLLGKN
jgi:hypothetical protein